MAPLRLYKTDASPLSRPLAKSRETRDFNSYFTFVVFALVYENGLKYNACAYINAIKLVRTAGESLINSTNGLRTALWGRPQKE